jgi:hypothetical protein
MLPAEFPEMVKKDLMGWHFEEYPTLPDFVPQICDVRQMPDDADYYSDTVVAGLGDPEQMPIDQQVRTDKIAEAYTWYSAVRPYKLGLTYGESFLKKSARKMGIKLENDGRRLAQSFMKKRNKMLADVFNRGAFIAGIPDIFNADADGQVDPQRGFIYDGKPLFGRSTQAHPLKLKPAATYSNLLASTALDYAGIGTMELLMTDTNAFDERQEKIVITPDVIVVPSALKNKAKQLLGSEAETAKGIGDINVFKGEYTPIVFPYLTTANAWFMGVRNKGIVWWEQGTLDIKVYELPNRSWLVDAAMYWGVSVSDWRMWTASYLATS